MMHIIIFARFEASVHKTLYGEGNLDFRGIYPLFLKLEYLGRYFILNLVMSQVVVPIIGYF